MWHQCGTPLPKPAPVPRFWVKRSLKANVIGIVFFALVAILLLLVCLSGSDAFRFWESSAASVE